MQSLRSISVNLPLSRGSGQDEPRLPLFLGRHPPPVPRRCVSLPKIVEDHALLASAPRSGLRLGGPDKKGHSKRPILVPIEVFPTDTQEVEQYPLQHRRSSMNSERSTRGGSSIPSTECSEPITTSPWRRLSLLSARRKVSKLWNTLKDCTGKRN